MPPAIDALCESLDMIQLERHEKLLQQMWKTSNGTSAGRADMRQNVGRLDEALQTMRLREQRGNCRTKVLVLTSWAS